MKTKKIALACFIGGGVLGMGTALLVAPALRWLGLFAGFAGGYFGYEFREVLKAVPVAAKDAFETVGDGWGRFREWHSSPARFEVYPAVLTGLLLAAVTANVVPALSLNIDTEIIPLTVLMFLCAFFAGCFIFDALAEAGCTKKGWFIPCLKLGHGAMTNLLPATYANILRAAGWGLWFFIRDCVLTTIHALVSVGRLLVWVIPCALCRFVWLLFVLIHKQERLLCGIDCALGVGAALLWTPAGLSASGAVLYMVFAGLLSAFFGVVNYDLVSRRWLKLVPA